MQQEQKEKGFVFQFKQQIMKAWQPIPTLNKTILLFTFLGILFLTLGILLQVLTQQVTQYRIRYDNSCPSGTNQCTQTLNINSNMQGPVFVYYQLTNFYQNHRLYVKSYSQNQLVGKTATASSISTDCDPIVHNSDLYVTKAIDGTPLVPNAIANPCGLIAYTIFNDSYTITALNNSQVNIDGTGIAWPTDLKRYKLTNASQMWVNVTDERFMVWMRIAALPNFRKIWGRINQDLPAGSYTVNITNNFNVSSINSEKYFVISQSNALGSKNEFLSIAYLTVGSVCIVIAIVFGIKKINKMRKEGKQL